MSDFLLNLARRGAGLATSSSAETMAAPAPQPNLGDVPGEEHALLFSVEVQPATATHEDATKPQGNTIVVESGAGREPKRTADALLHLTSNGGPETSRSEALARPQVNSVFLSVASDVDVEPGLPMTPEPNRPVNDPPAAAHSPAPIDKREPAGTPVSFAERHEPLPVPPIGGIGRMSIESPRVEPQAVTARVARLDTGESAPRPEARPALVTPAPVRMPDVSSARNASTPARPDPRGIERRITHVRIGRIEIRSAPPPAPQIEPQAAPASEGFEQYARLRTYLRNDY